MNGPVDRRRFLTVSAAVFAARPGSGAAGGRAREGGELPAAEGKGRPPGEALRRPLGRTGIEVFPVGLGGSPVPAEAVFRRALERGVNYVDTSPSYMNGNSERIIGRLIEGRREQVCITTKFHPARRGRKTRRQIAADLETGLKRLGTDYVDGFLLHGAVRADQLLDEEVLAAFEALKKAGRIRFCGASCHRDPAGVLLPAVRKGYLDVVTVAFSAYSAKGFDKDKVYKDLLRASGLDVLFAEARKRGVGVVAMKTMAGGARQDLSAFRGREVTPAQAKLRWVLSREGVSCAVTEMPTFEILEENLAAAERGPAPGEEEALDAYVRATSSRTCRFCGSCLPACPQGIPVPDLLRYLAYHDGSHGKKAAARAAYRAVPRERNAAACRECGRCEAACPFGVDTRSLLRRAAALLGRG